MHWVRKPKAAAGAVALAHDFACGGFAQALDANNDDARDFILSQGFFQASFGMIRWMPWMNLIWILPLVKWWRLVKSRKMPRGCKCPIEF